MYKAIICFFLFLNVLACGDKPDQSLTYQTYCAGCHGKNLEGTTSGSALIRPEYKSQSANDSISQAISEGVAGTTMIAWGKLLKADEINGLTEYILQAQDQPLSTSVSDTPSTLVTENYQLLVEPVVASGLSTPWGIEFITADRILISEKPGSLRWIINGNLDPDTIKGLPETHLMSSTGGFMDIALDPVYDQNGWIYLAYSHTNGDMKDRDALALTKVVRGRIVGMTWTDQQTLFEVPDSLMVVRGNRWGCRLLFDDEGYLYFTIGDMAQAMDSQDPAKATGKVFRIHPDGSIPEDNPFLDRRGALGAVYTLGNRNVQGLAIHPSTREIWSTDHGPKGGDEINILRKGLNYGWPVITYGVDYTDEIISTQTHQEGMVQPVWYWTPSIGVCAAEFCSSPLFPLWENDLLVGSLVFQELHRLVVNDDQVQHTELLIKGLGRIRDLKFSPDGSLYLVMNDPDRILRITPQSILHPL